MERNEIEHKWVKVVSLFLISILMILFYIYFTPDYVARKLSPDGILELKTIALIKKLRIGFSIIGILGLLVTLLFLIKPYLFNSLTKNSALKNSYLFIILSIFLILTLIMSLKTTVGSIIRWQDKTRNKDAHSLRLEFHHWYRRQHMIWEFIQSNIHQNEPLLINAHNCPSVFFAYYLAPRSIYSYSDNFAAELDKSGRNYYVLTMTWDKHGKVMEWSIIEKPIDFFFIKRRDIIKR
jgi:hypothetical protein